MSRLLHYSNHRIGAVYSVPQDDLSGSGWAKPRGLWVSVEGDDDWRSWCESESFGNPSSQVCHEVTLADDAKIFRITTEAQLRKFAREYEYDPYMHLSAPTYYSRLGVDWTRLSKKYDGIIIAPYQWECRFSDDTRWYYGWDCASGCIWNARAIERIDVLEPAASPLPQQIGGER